MARKIAPPTLPSRAEAPTTATDAGASSGRSETTAATCVRSAERSSKRAVGRRSSERWTSPNSVWRRVSKPAPAKTPQHRAVAGHHLGVEARDAALGRDLGELLEQSRGQAAAVHLVGHREGDLGRAGLVEAVVARDGDHAPVEVGQQRHPRVAVGVGVVARHDVGAPEAVEAQIAALGREGIEERLDVGLVLGPRRAQPQRGAIAQDDVANDARPGPR